MIRERLTVWVMVQALIVVQTTAIAQSSHEQGIAAGRAANATIRGLVNQPSATTVVPGYTAAPPQAALAGRAALGADVNAKLAACTATSKSAKRPRPEARGSATAREGLPHGVERGAMLRWGFGPC